MKKITIFMASGMVYISLISNMYGSEGRKMYQIGFPSKEYEAKFTWSQNQDCSTIELTNDVEKNKNCINNHLQEKIKKYSRCAINVHAVYENTMLLFEYAYQHPRDITALLLEGIKLPSDFSFSNNADKIPSVPIIMIVDETDRNTPLDKIVLLYALARRRNKNIYLLPVAEWDKRKTRNIVNTILQRHGLYSGYEYFGDADELLRVSQPEDEELVKGLNERLEKEKEEFLEKEKKAQLEKEKIERSRKKLEEEKKESLEKEKRAYLIGIGKYVAMGCVGLFLLYKIIKALGSD